MSNNRKVSTAEHANRPSTGQKNSKGSIPDGTRRGIKKDSQLQVAEKALDLDDVLVNELGQFGLFQLKNVLLVAVPIILSAFTSEFIFSAASVPYRCRITECGEENNTGFEQDWLSGVIPDDGTANCERYVPLYTNWTGSLDYCPSTMFDSSRTESCPYGYVYGRTNSVVYDFDLGCNEWLRALAGTLSSVGSLLVLPVTGYISDKCGRRITLVVSVFNLALIGLIRAFSVNYPMYLVLQVLQTTLGSGTLSAAYILATELVGPKFRVATSTTYASMFAIGQIVLGAIAWMVQPWRYMIMTLYIPCFFIITYYWFLSESFRWLLSKQRYDEAKEVLENVARVNKTHISEKSMNALLTPPAPSDASETPKEVNNNLWSTIIRSPILLRRVCTTPVWWVTTTFVYYGLSINSTSLSDTIYLNFILTCAIEIPGNFVALFTLDLVGRRLLLFFGFILSSICNIAFAFISTELTVLRLVIYLLGKFSISVVFTTLYLYTSELYPTEYRHSLLAFSSMIGRIGSITAPLTPALMVYWEGIPSMMFGVMGLISGALVFTQPETLGTKMPDTLAEAEALGTPQSIMRS